MHSTSGCSRCRRVCLFIRTDLEKSFMSCLTAPIHCKGSIDEQWWCNATFIQISSDKDTNSSTPWMARGRAHFQLIFTLGWMVPLRELNRVSFDFLHTRESYWPEYVCVLELGLSVDWSSRLEIRDASLAVLVKLRSDRVWSVWGVWVTLWDTLSDSFTDEPCCCFLLRTDLWGKYSKSITMWVCTSSTPFIVI